MPCMFQDVPSALKQLDKMQHFHGWFSDVEGCWGNCELNVKMRASPPVPGSGQVAYGEVDVLRDLLRRSLREIVPF